MGPSREPSEPFEVQRDESRDARRPQASRARSGFVTRARRLPREGERVDGYVVERSLQIGGTAAVIVGRDDKGEAVALKFLHPHLAEDEDMLDMQRAEAAILARLSHPNVARVRGFSFFEGLPYLALELVDGPTLRDLVLCLHRARRWMSGSLSVAIAVCVADALAAAHDATDERGSSLRIVHRDVSPSNILVSRDGVVKLIDFGVARSTARATLTNVGTFKGKAGYAAPEQLRGGPVDHRADLFALGVILHELLSMRRLFPGRALDILRHRMEPTPIVRLDEADPSVPRALADVIASCLAPDPEQRPASARELARGLRAVLPDAARVSRADLAALLAEYDLLEAARADTPETPLAVGDEHTTDVGLPEGVVSDGNPALARDVPTPWVFRRPALQRDDQTRPLRLAPPRERLTRNPSTPAPAEVMDLDTEDHTPAPVRADALADSETETEGAPTAKTLALPPLDSSEPALCAEPRVERTSDTGDLPLGDAAQDAPKTIPERPAARMSAPPPSKKKWLDRALVLLAIGLVGALVLLVLSR